MQCNRSIPHHIQANMSRPTTLTTQFQEGQKVDIKYTHQTEQAVCVGLPQSSHHS